MFSSPARTVADLDSRATRFETQCGGGQMIWRRWSKDPDNAREPLVLLHGGSGSWTHWIQTIPALVERYEVWAPDMPGLGDSAMPPEPLTPASCGAVVASGIRTLLGATRPHLVCFSFGCHVGTLAAAELGRQVRSLTLSGSAALGLPHLHADFAKEHSRMTPADRADVHRGNLHILMIANADRIDDLAIQIQSDNIAKARFRSRPFATTDEIKRMLAHITAPVGAIWGEHDQICRVGGADTRFAAIRESHPRLVARLVPDAGHWAMYEQPEVFNAALGEVLAELERQAS
jgi:2-hydroxy-6-oxonona-2,4-dienedioate hydrolase